MPTGQRTTSSINQDRRIEDFTDKIHNVELDPQVAPFFTLSNGMKRTRTVKNLKYSILEKTLRERYGTVNGDIALVTETSIPLNGNFEESMLPDTVIRNMRTEEVMLVSTVDASGNLVTVIRNMGGAGAGAEGTGIAMLDNDVIEIVTDSSEEGGLSPDALSQNTETSFNYIMKIKTAIELSVDLQNNDLYGGADLNQERMEKAIEHKIAIERALWFSVLREENDVANPTKKIRHTGGILQHVVGNILDVGSTYGGILTSKVFDRFGEIVFENNTSGVIHLFGGMRPASALDSIARNVVRVGKGEGSFGTNMQEFTTNKGTFRYVLTSKVFNQNLSGTVIALDMANVNFVLRQNGGTRLEKNIQENDRDGDKEQWITNFGLELIGYGLQSTRKALQTPTVYSPFASKHGKMIGITDY